MGPALLRGQEILQREGDTGKGPDVFARGKTRFQFFGGFFRVFEFRIDERIQILIMFFDAPFKIPDHFRGGNVSGIHFSSDLCCGEQFQVFHRISPQLSRTPFGQYLSRYSCPTFLSFHFCATW